MKKKWIAILMSVLMVSGSIGTIPVHAADVTVQETVAMGEDKQDEDVQIEYTPEKEELTEEDDRLPGDETEIFDSEAGSSDVEESEETGTIPAISDSSEVFDSESSDDSVSSDDGESFDDSVSSDDSIFPDDSESQEYSEFPDDSESPETARSQGEEEPVEIEEAGDLAEMNDAINDGSEVVIDSGGCGDQASWKLTGSDTEMTLTISGSGPMMSDLMYSPYRPYRENVVELIVEDGITSLGNFAFQEFTRLEKATLPDTLSSMGKYCFYRKLRRIPPPSGGGMNAAFGAYFPSPFSNSDPNDTCYVHKNTCLQTCVLYDIIKIQKETVCGVSRTGV